MTHIWSFRYDLQIKQINSQTKAVTPPSEPNSALSQRIIESKGMMGTDMYLTVVSVRQLNQTSCLLTERWPLLDVSHYSKPCHATIRCLICRLVATSMFYQISTFTLLIPFLGSLPVQISFCPRLRQLSPPNTEPCTQQTITGHVKGVLIWYWTFQGVWSFAVWVWFFFFKEGTSLM